MSRAPASRVIWGSSPTGTCRTSPIPFWRRRSEIRCELTTLSPSTWARCVASNSASPRSSHARLPSSIELWNGSTATEPSPRSTTGSSAASVATLGVVSPVAIHTLPTAAIKTRAERIHPSARVTRWCPLAP